MKHNKKGRTDSNSFVMLTNDLLDSPAWLDLTPAARTVYVHLVRRHNGHNNGTIAFSVRDAASACRVNKDTARKAFASLQQHGFIDLVKRGGFSLKLRHAAEWRLTAVKCNRTNTPPTRAFNRWRPPPKI